MHPLIFDKIQKDYPAEQQEEVLSLLSSIGLDHVMAESEINLLNTRLAVLHIAVGKIDDLGHYVNAAKTDFRDVILWALESGEFKQVL